MKAVVFLSWGGDVLNVLLEKVQSVVHSRCIVCGSDSEQGLKLKFRKDQEGCIEGLFEPSKRWEGYDGMMHGGVISMLLDGVMINCLFAEGIKALTAELKVRFLLPVDAGSVVRLRAWVQVKSSIFYLLKAELFQGDKTKATAVGKFVCF